MSVCVLKLFIRVWPWSHSLNKALIHKTCICFCQCISYILHCKVHFKEFAVSKHRPHACNVNNLHDGFDHIHYMAGHNLIITFEVFEQTPNKVMTPISKIKAGPSPSPSHQSIPAILVCLVLLESRVLESRPISLITLHLIIYINGTDWK